MDREDIIRMAREQGLPETETEGVFRVNTDDLGRMLAAEREACAKVCDQMFHDWCNQEFEDEDEAYRNRPDAEDCKKAIRERGNT